MKDTTSEEAKPNVKGQGQGRTEGRDGMKHRVDASGDLQMRGHG
jgi:hypothetical protein